MDFLWGGSQHWPQGRPVPAQWVFCGVDLHTGPRTSSTSTVGFLWGGSPHWRETHSQTWCKHSPADHPTPYTARNKNLERRMWAYNGLNGLGYVHKTILVTACVYTVHIPRYLFNIKNTWHRHLLYLAESFAGMTDYGTNSEPTTYCTYTMLMFLYSDYNWRLLHSWCWRWLANLQSN